MSTQPIPVTCPHCGCTRGVPPEKLPDRPVRATCPRCKRTFTFDPAAATPAPNGAPRPAPSMQPTPAPPPQSPPPGPESPASPKHRPPPPPPPPRPKPPAASPPPAAPAGGRGSGDLAGITDLLASAWTSFQTRFGVLFAIYLLTIVLMLAPPFVGAGLGMLLVMVFPLGKGAIMAVCTGIGGIAGMAGSFWGMGALLSAALDDGLNIRTSFAAARTRIASLFWICLLTGFIVAGGFFLFIIPGIVFSVWFLTAPFVLADGDGRGMAALLKSRSLVTGRWFDVFLRLVILWGVSALIAAIPMLGPLLLLIATPYLVLCQALLYKDLKRTSGKRAVDCSLKDRLRWPTVAAVGHVALPVILVGVFGVSFLGGLQSAARKSGLEIAAVRSPEQPAAGDGVWRVIPIPGSGGEQPVQPKPEGGPSVQIASPSPSGGQGDRTPDNIHIFIYAVNAPGRVLANGVELKQIGDTPDMQYNYNMSGDKLRFGRNTITVEYTPLAVTGNMLKPKIHLKISRSSGGQRQVLGDWNLEETSPGQRNFDLDVPDEPARL